MEESALNRAAGPGSGAPHVGAEWGRGPEGGGRSQRRGSATGLIGRGWSCGGRKGEGITCGSAAHGGGAPRRGSCRERGWGYRSPGPGAGAGCRLTELDTQRQRVGKPGAGGQSKPRIQEGDSRCLGKA